MKIQVTVPNYALSTSQSFELKATETNSAGFEETRNFWRLIALTSKTC